MFKHWFCWKYQYNKYMLNFINIYSFIPVSDCVGMGPSVLLCPGAYNAFKMALSFSNFKFSIPTNVGEENSKLKKTCV
jgi:hypothetical protein